MNSGTTTSHKFEFAGLSQFAAQLTAASTKLKTLDANAGMTLFETALTDYTTKVSTYEGTHRS